MSENRYVLQQKIGEGSIGEVWLATDELLGRTVAIKYLHTPDQPIHRDLFVAEARMLARLNHPRITTLYDAVFEDDRCYLVMEYAPGQPLSHLLGNHLTLAQVLDIAIRILQALQYAHAQGIVHRDIKPDNVLVEEDIKLTDFGFANLVSLLQAGSDYQLGTPSYMSPEQIQGLSTDARSDLYAFGVMFYEMLTGGNMPYAYDDVDRLLEAHLKEPPISIRQYLPDIPPILEYTLNRLLAKDRDDRYPSADALLHVLGAVYARQRFSQPHLQLLSPGDRPLVGREAEMERLAGLWQTVREKGQPELAVIQGGAGMGKSRLAAEFLGPQAEQNYPVLIGRCDDAPYTPYADLLATIFDVYPGAISACAVEQQRRLLTQIPGLAHQLSLERESLPAAVSPQQAQWEFFEAVLEILARLGPAIVFLENAHCLDESSLALTQFLLRRGRLPLFILAACRDDEGEVRWLKSCGDCVAIALSGLSDAAVKQMLDNRLGGAVAEAAARTVIRRSLGNPLFVEEVARFLTETGELFFDREAGEWQYKRRGQSGSLPPTLINVFQQRLNRLSASARQSLAAAAILGTEFDYAVWRALLDNQERPALAALDEALAHGLAREVAPERYAFIPSNLAAILSEETPTPRRRFLHGQAALFLSRQPRPDPARLGHHYEQAGQPLEAADWWARAGDRAAGANAIGEAIDYYQHSANLREAGEIYEKMGQLYRQQGAYDRAINSYRAALALFEQNDDVTGSAEAHRSAQARALGGLAFVYWLSDRYRPAYQTALAVLKLPGVPKAEQAAAYSHLGMVAWLSGQLAEAESWCRRAVDGLVGNGDQATLAGAYNRLGLVYFSMGRLNEASRLFELSLTIRRGLRDLWGEGYCLNNLAKVAIERGEFSQAVALLGEAEQLFNRLDSRDGLMVVYTNQGRACLRQGGALKLLTRALRLGLELGKWSGYGLGDIYLLIAEAELLNGRLALAEISLNEGLGLAEKAGNREYMAAGYALRARLEAARENVEAALNWVKQAMALHEQVGSWSGLLRARLVYAGLLDKQGQSEAADALRGETQAAAREEGL